MPDLDYAVLCEYVRTEGGLAHVIAAGLDTVYAEQVPTGRNFGLLVLLKFTRAEAERPHRLEIIVQDTDGKQVVTIQAIASAPWAEGLPPGWKTGGILGVNFGVPLPDYGVYSVEVMLNDSNVKSIGFRVVPPPGAATEGG